MAIIQKIFAYNTGSLISGTTQVGDIAVSEADVEYSANYGCLLYTSPSPRDRQKSRMPSSA